VPDLLNDVLGDDRIEFLPLTLPILQESLRADSVPEMHDRLMVASLLYLESLGQVAPLLTKDTEIAAFAPVRIVWCRFRICAVE
jgi:hypothetical protein